MYWSTIFSLILGEDLETSILLLSLQYMLCNYVYDYQEINVEHPSCGTIRKKLMHHKGDMAWLIIDGDARLLNASRQDLPVHEITT